MLCAYVVRSYLLGYCAIMAASVGFYVVALAVFVFGTLRASRVMHLQLVTSVLSTTLRYYLLKNLIDWIVLKM